MNGSGPPQVSVIIPARNEAQAIRLCLEAICAGSYTDFEIIIIDDASTDATFSIASSCEDPRVRIQRNSKSLGPARCLNLGAKTAAGQYLLFTDADCFADPNWIAEAVMELSDETACAVEGTIRYQVAQTRFWHKIPLNPYYNLARGAELSVGGQDFPSGNFAIKREYFEALGGFNWSRYPNGREDTDLGLRLSRLGAVKFNRNMVVTHKFEVWTLSSLIKNTRRYAADVKILKDHGQFPYLKGRIMHPRFLLLLFFPPLIFIYYKISSFRSLCFLPKFLVYLFCLRLVIWRTALTERVMVL